jgi:hypothetical protein
MALAIYGVNGPAQNCTQQPPITQPARIRKINSSRGDERTRGRALRSHRARGCRTARAPPWRPRPASAGTSCPSRLLLCPPPRASGGERETERSISPASAGWDRENKRLERESAFARAGCGSAVFMSLACGGTRRESLWTCGGGARVKGGAGCRGACGLRAGRGARV